MKRILFLIILTSVICSCSVGEAENNDFVVLPVFQVDVPTTFKVDSISNFTIRYKRPTDCYIFNGIYYNAEGYNRDVAIKAVQLLEGNCTADDESVYEIPLRFKPTISGSYNFKFWLGTNVEGVNQYYNAAVIVP